MGGPSNWNHGMGTELPPGGLTNQTLEVVPQAPALLHQAPDHGHGDGTPKGPPLGYGSPEVETNLVKSSVPDIHRLGIAPVCSLKDQRCQSRHFSLFSGGGPRDQGRRIREVKCLEKGGQQSREILSAIRSPDCSPEPLESEPIPTPLIP